jgi:uncharacterized membrane protein
MPDTATFCPGCGSPMQPPTRFKDKVGLLTENVAGALAYLTFIPAIFFLLRPPYNRNPFVRFHSVQSLMLWLACAAIAAALRLAGLLIVLIPTLGPLLITLLYGVAALAPSFSGRFWWPRLFREKPCNYRSSEISPTTTRTRSKPLAMRELSTS